MQNCRLANIGYCDYQLTTCYKRQPRDSGIGTTCLYSKSYNSLLMSSVYGLVARAYLGSPSSTSTRTVTLNG